MILADAAAEAFYREALDCLERSGVSFLLGGAYALAHYTGIVRRTKDLDVFIRPADCGRALRAFEEEGYRTEVTDSDWLAKAYREPYFVDIIFSSGNSIATVDDGWFEHAALVRALGRDVKIAPVEEMIWSKTFVMERERFDGADVLHLILKRSKRIDWIRLLDRMAEHWQVLLAHLVLFQYCYPSERENVPLWVLDRLQAKMRKERVSGNASDRICRGPLISRAQYTSDLEDGGFMAPERPPVGLVLAGSSEEEEEGGEERDDADETQQQEDTHSSRRGSALSRRQRGTPA